MKLLSISEQFYELVPVTVTLRSQQQGIPSRDLKAAGRVNQFHQADIKGCNHELLAKQRRSRFNLLHPSSALQFCEQSMIKCTESGIFEFMTQFSFPVHEKHFLLCVQIQVAVIPSNKTCLWCGINCSASCGYMSVIEDNKQRISQRSADPAVKKKKTKQEDSEPESKIRPQC